jgi:hypothetical protein
MRILAQARTENTDTKVCAHEGCEETGAFHCEHCDTWYCAKHAGRAGDGRLRGAHRAS